VTRHSITAAPARITVEALLAAVRRRLEKARLAYGHGTTNARDEAAWLVLRALRLPLDPPAPFLQRNVTPAEQRRTWRLVERRIRQRLPAAYLLREAWLGELRFYVDQRVIVPRSFIAELLRDRLAPWLRHSGRVRDALDLCTGSGCLAILLAKTFSGARVDAVDISRNALAVARRNIATYRLRSRIRLLHSDMFAAVKKKRYNLIIANPPYVNAAAMRALPSEFRREPKLALTGGKDGFDFVRIILKEATEHLTDNGLLVVEIGHYRKQLEKAFPRLPFVWPLTSGGDDCVFILERRDLPEQAAPAMRRRIPRAGARPRRRRVPSADRA